MSDLTQEQTDIARRAMKQNPVLDLSGGPSGSVKLPPPIGEREMIFNRAYTQDAELEQKINDVNSVIQLSRMGKTPSRDQLISKRKSASRAVIMILGLSEEEVATISHENQVGIIMHYRLRSSEESLSPLLAGEDDD